MRFYPPNFLNLRFLTNCLKNKKIVGNLAHLYPNTKLSLRSSNARKSFQLIQLGCRDHLNVTEKRTKRAENQLFISKKTILNIYFVVPQPEHL